MKGKIDTLGRLWIERGGIMKAALCPFDRVPPIAPCADHCPHFGEPHKYRCGPDALLPLCHGTEWLFSEFTDERGRQDRQESRQ